MKNPWNEIPLADYENHMRLASVMQLQAMNEMMKEQLNSYSVSTVMIFGIAGGNGLEHIQKDKLKKVYGIDINPSYLKAVVERFPKLHDILECRSIDLITDADQLPKADMILANLLIEYIGYDCFLKAVKQVQPRFVSCIIQVDMENDWVSDSPYLHVFDKLEQVHQQIDQQTLENEMAKIDYHAIKTSRHLLPNEKMLVQIDFEKQSMI